LLPPRKEKLEVKIKSLLPDLLILLSFGLFILSPLLYKAIKLGMINYVARTAKHFPLGIFLLQGVWAGDGKYFI